MDMQTEGQDHPIAPRGVQVLLFVVIALAIVGFFVGIDQGVTKASPQNEPAATAPAHGFGVAIPAASYDEMPHIKAGPNAAWKSDFARIARDNASILDEYTPTEQDRARSRAARAERRAYHGAPPTIPHAVDTASNNNCMACHQDSVRIGDAVAGAIPHPYLASCQQCHAPAHSEGFPTGFEPPANSFQGAEAPLRGQVAWEGAPPIIPHSTLMRNDCMSCHGPNGDQGLRTPHPWQVSCVQCHAPSAELDQRMFSAQPEWFSTLLSSSASEDQAQTHE